MASDYMHFLFSYVEPLVFSHHACFLLLNLPVFNHRVWFCLLNVTVFHHHVWFFLLDNLVILNDGVLNSFLFFYSLMNLILFPSLKSLRTLFCLSKKTELMGGYMWKHVSHHLHGPLSQISMSNLYLSFKAFVG